MITMIRFAFFSLIYFEVKIPGNRPSSIKGKSAAAFIIVFAVMIPAIV